MGTARQRQEERGREARERTKGDAPPQRPNLDRAPGESKPFTKGEKDYDPTPIKPKRFVP